MKTLRERISELEIHTSKLEPAEWQRDEYISHTHDFAVRFLNGLSYVKAFSDKKPEKGLLRINGKPKPLKKLIESFDSEVACTGINCASGGHFGYIPGGGLYVSALADYLAAVTNAYAGLYYASPGAVVIENEVIRWIKSVFGFPEESTGTLTSGGSVANLIGLTAARDHHKIKDDIIRKSVVYLSPQTHHCIHKALKIIGLEDVILRYAVLDKFFRINPEVLDQQIRQDLKGGLNPFLIIATAGTTDTGSVDPITETGRIAMSHKLWYHVDAAYGGFFILTSQKKEILDGLKMADSLVIDPHKGLFIPYGTGAVLIKDRFSLERTYRYSANYMQDSFNVEYTMDNPADVSPELTRHFRALRLWLPLQIHGTDIFSKCLEEKLLLTEYFRTRLEDSGFRTGPKPDLSVSYFWYESQETDEDAYNRKLLELLHKDGSVFFSSTVIEGKFVIRIAILSFRTKLSHVDKAIELLNQTRLRMEKEFSLK